MASPLILLVDEDAEQRQIYADLLLRAGYQVADACNGAEATQLAQERAPQLIVLDLVLPDMSGIQLFELLRSMPETAAIPVIAITADVLWYSEYALPEIGFAAFLVKPVLPSTLLLSALSLIEPPASEEDPPIPLVE